MASLLYLALSLPAVVFGQTNILVTTMNPTGAGSLASAINLANTLSGSNLITLASNVIYSYSAPDNYWYGPNALPPIASDITIEGNGSVLVRTTSSRLRFFYVGADPNNPATSNYNSPGAGKLTLRHLTLTNGLALGGNGGGGGAGMGGAIFNQGILVLDSITIAGNAAWGGKGDDLSNGATGGGMGQDSGGFGGSVVPSGSFGAPGFGPQGGGGGGFGLTDNATNSNGGGVPDGLGGGANSGNGSGGGTSSLSTNGGGSGGNFGFSGMVGAGSGISRFPGAPPDAGSGGGGVGGGGGGGQPDFAEGGGPGAAGGFGGGGGSPLDINFFGNSGGQGGFGGGGGGDNGVGGYGGGTSGGYYRSGAGGGAGLGGAIFNHNGTLIIQNCTLTQNIATGGVAGDSQYTYSGGGSGLGGAIFNLNGNLSVINSSFSANGVVSGLGGRNHNAGLNSPLGPSGGASGGAIFNLAYDSSTKRTASSTLINSILADSMGGSNLACDEPSFTVAGTNLATAVIIATEPNIIQTFTNAGGSFTNSAVLTNNPLLGPLANNGGLTLTMVPLPGSPAIGAGDTNSAPSADQRGQPRVPALGIDLGAVQVSLPPSIVGFNFSGGKFQLQFRAATNVSYSILTTTNLSTPMTNWTYIGAATFVSNNIFQFTDTNPVSAPFRYYRVRQP